ncbi:hypothetical protein BSPWISOXPB_7341 [uncultured Gammaproteobacteria bacterium]|nr:hypothetical protein BSPWISOXPB_7341 [uncultured Gammaproteobacteria bacterium]
MTSQDDTHITASNITNQNGVMTGNNINLNAQNTLLNQSGDITAVNNLKLKQRLLPILPVNKPSQKAQTSLRALAVLKPTRRQCQHQCQDITNTASNITANNLDITANNLNIATHKTPPT